MELSPRLEMVASLVLEAKDNAQEPLRVADIGTDHGYLALALVERGTAARVIASDINDGPLMRAGEHVKENDNIELRLSDGLLAYRPGEVDTAVMAGMGGRLIRSIITKTKPAELGIRELILQPQSELFMLRVFLREAGYIAVNERMVVDSGKYYTALRVIDRWSQQRSRVFYDREDSIRCGGLIFDETADDKAQRIFDRFGQHLMGNCDPVLSDYLKGRTGILEKILEEVPEKNLKRRGELEEELEDTRRAYEIIRYNQTA